ncbi:hypothetical protein HMPREF9320_1498 [Streptococcus pseudoporcinus SPIN 20026]|nr:hypothetical protein HMPREF9320_1498 [Streptococcus pseudoporcinus SPIN 20026]
MLSLEVFIFFHYDSNMELKAEIIKLAKEIGISKSVLQQLMIFPI